MTTAGSAGSSRFCTACGTALAEGAEFCSKCGARVGAAPEAGVARATTAGRVATDRITLQGSDYHLGSFWRRLGALLIDGVVSLMVGLLLLGALWSTIAPTMPRFDGGTLRASDWDWLAGALHTFIRGITVLSVAGTVAGLTFETFGWSPGKAAFGLRVLREDGRPPGVVHGAARYVGKAVSGAPLLLGYLWAAWDPQRQTWHDKFASTFVVLVPVEGMRAPAGPAPLALSTGARVWAGLCVLYVLYNAFSLASLQSTFPRDGVALERYFEDLTETDEPLRPFGPRTQHLEPHRPRPT